MKEHFRNLREVLRRENILVCDQRNMNPFLWSYMLRKRHNFELRKMSYDKSGRMPALKRTSQSIEITRRRLRVLRHSAIGVGLLPPYWHQCHKGRATHQG